MSLLGTVWCNPPAMSHALVAAEESGARPPSRTADREARHRMGRADQVDLVDQEPETITHVNKGCDDGRSGGGVEHKAHRVVASADRKRVDLATR